MHSICTTSVLDFFFSGKFGSGTKHATVLKPDWVLNKQGDAQNFASSSSKIVHFL